MKSKILKSLHTSCAINIIALIPFTTGVHGQNINDNASATVKTTDKKATPSELTLDEIVVTGVRGSLTKSIRTKRNANIVLESINATELGRFPDSDVADSLSHLNGITINRTTGGDGQHVTIRGLNSSYNIVTLNERILATDDDGRDFAFDILPSDVISGADVIKSSEASAIEGSIGGTVNLRSARAFDHAGFTGAARLEGNYNDMSHNKGGKVSGFLSYANSGKTLGILVGAVYSNIKTRTDALNYQTYDANNPGVYPFAPTQGDPVPVDAKPVVALCCLSFGSVVDQKKRIALTSTVEWRPTPTLHIVADAMYTRLNDPQVAYNQGYFPDFTYDHNGLPEWSNVTVKNGLITSFTGNNFTPEVINQTIDRVVNTYLFGLNATWEVNSRLTLKADVYRSLANRPEGGKDNFVTAGLVSNTPYNQNTISVSANPNALPNISVTLPDGTDYAHALASGQLNDQSRWSTHYVGLGGYSIRDVVTSGKIDGTFAVDSGFLSGIDFGVGYTKRGKTRNDISNDWNNGSNQYGSLYNTLTTRTDNQPLIQSTPITFATLGGGIISTFNFPNYLQGAGGNVPTTSVLLNAPALLNALKKLDGTPNYTAGNGTYLFANTLPALNATNSYLVSEQTFSSYLEARFKTQKLSGNIGVRLVYTRTTASTAVDAINSITVADTSVPTNPGTVIITPAKPISDSNSYFLPLPSVNLNYEVMQNLQFRLAVAKVLSRPSLNQLAPTSTNNAINRVFVLNYSGNTGLKPIKAWQADASLEWYYAPRDLVSVGVFKKWLRDDITTVQLDNVDIGAVGCYNGNPCVPQLFSVIKPLNGSSGQVYGIELGWQHLLDNGLGIRAQFTHNWSQSTVNGVTSKAAGVVPTTVSINVFYEKGPISISANIDHSSSFVFNNTTEIPDQNAIASRSNWVTATASYQLTDNFKIYLDGRNLTNSIVRTFLNGNPYATWAGGATPTGSSVDAGYTAYGRTITAGVAAKF